MGVRGAAYIRALAITAAALLLRLALAPVLEDTFPHSVFILAAALSGAYDGLGPGIFTVLLGAFATAYFLIPPYGRFPIPGGDNVFELALYLMVSGLILALTERQRRARTRAEAAAVERERAEAAERLQRQWLEITLSSIGDAVIAAGADAHIVFINKTAQELTGWPAAEAAGRALEEVFCIRNEETGAEVESPLGRAIREERMVGPANHAVLVARQGKRVPIDESAAPIVDSSGNVVGAVLVFRDVTEARAQEAELRARDQMINLSHDAIITADASRRIRTWNRGAEEMYGWREEEARGQLIHELLHTRNPEPIPAVDEALRRHARWEGELIQAHKDGRELIAESRQMLLRDARGEVAGILEINRDITDRKRATEEAEEGRRTLHALLEHIPEGIAIADAPDGLVRMVSRHGLELLGRPREAVENLTGAERPWAWGICRADGRTPATPEELPMARAMAGGKDVTGEEWTIRRPDGVILPILCNAAPIRDAAGKITGGLLAWRDLSQRKQLEEKLRETAKLESLGVLAGGIAHDFNNLLTGILGNADLLMESIRRSAPEFSFAEGIFKAAERAAGLTQQMLAYSGRGRFVIQPVDLSAYIRDTITLIEASIPKNVELRLDLARGLPPVEADTAQLQQLVMNLAVNGAEAIGQEGGRLLITTRMQAVDEAYIRTLRPSEEVAPGRYVVLDVQDTGCGMDPATMARIFEPFFTTKFAGRGLGLAAVQGIVRGHKGAIKVYSEPGKGTTFRVLLPADTTAQPQARGDLTAIAASDGGGTVLLVDDEPVVRQAGKAALERLGYEVIVAEDGCRAVEIFGANPHGIRLIVLDMTMPGISGEEAMRRFREVNPAVPILLSSGFSEMEALSRFGRYHLAGFLQKPFTVAALAEKVKAATAG